MSHKENNVCFSNSLYHLLAKLSVDLFSKQQEPFSKRRILVPTIEISNWIQCELIAATSNHTVLGSQFLISSEGFIKFLYTEYCSKTSDFPDFSTAPLWLYKKIQENTENPFKDFFQSLKASTPFHFIRSLTNAFRKYYINPQPTEDTKNPYQQFFEKVASHFVTPSNIIQEIQSQHCLEGSNMSLFVFTLSGISLKMLSFLSEIANQIPVYFYVLLPTKEYFGDMIPDKFIDRYLGRNEKCTSPLLSHEQLFLNNRNSLLANLSGSCRSALNFFLDKNLITTELFLPPKGDSSFDLMKKDLFYLQESPREAFLSKISSITIKRAPSRIREVQEIFHRISSLIYSGVHPREIRVLCKNMKDYAPIIRSVFSPYIPLSIRGVTSSAGELLQNKLHLISSLLLSSGNLASLHKLFSHPDIHAPTLKEENFNYFSTYLYDEFYKIPVSQRESGIHLAILADALISKYPFSEMTGKVVSIEILGEISLILYRLHSVIQNLHLDSVQKAKDIFDPIFSLIEDIFILDDDQILLIDKLKKSIFPYREQEYAISFFIEFCSYFLETSHQESPLPLGKLIVGPIQTLASIPSRYTFVLGASSAIQVEGEASSPDITDMDENCNNSDDKNSLFLEIITSTKDSLYISYPSSGENLESPFPAVKWIAEASYTTIEDIPSLPFSKEHFNTEKMSHYSVAKHFDLAKSLYTPKKSFDVFIAHDPLPMNEASPLFLSIDEIISTLKSPLEFFLKKRRLSLHIPRTITPSTPNTIRFDILSHIWTQYISGNLDITKEDTLPHKYLSELLKKDISRQSALLINFLESQQLTSIRFSPELFQDNPLILTAPEIELSWKGRNIKIRGQIHGVSANSLSFLSSDIVTSYKKSDYKGIFSSLSSRESDRLTPNLHLAILAKSDVLKTPISSLNLQEIFFHTNEIKNKIIPITFDPEEYLDKILDAYFSVLETPFPLYKYSSQSRNKWKAIATNKWEDFLSATNDSVDDTSSLFWASQNRNICQSSEENVQYIFELYHKLTTANQTDA